MRYFVDPLSWGMDSGNEGRGDGSVCGTTSHDGSGCTSLVFMPTPPQGHKALSVRSVKQNLHFFEAHPFLKLIFENEDFENVEGWKELAYVLSLPGDQLHALYNLKLLAKTNQQTPV